MRKMTMVAAGLACGLSLPAAHAADKVTIQLKWVAQAQFAGYFVAKEKGFYKDAGLDVMPSRRGSMNTSFIGQGPMKLLD